MSTEIKREYIEESPGFKQYKLLICYSPCGKPEEKFLGYNLMEVVKNLVLDKNSIKEIAFLGFKNTDIKDLEFILENSRIK